MVARPPICIVFSSGSAATGAVFSTSPSIRKNLSFSSPANGVRSYAGVLLPRRMKDSRFLHSAKSSSVWISPASPSNSRIMARSSVVRGASAETPSVSRIACSTATSANATVSASAHAPNAHVVSMRTLRSAQRNFMSLTPFARFRWKQGLLYIDVLKWQIVPAEVQIINIFCAKRRADD